jgi:DNA-binding MarR family transcriptional regulator
VDAPASTSEGRGPSAARTDELTDAVLDASRTLVAVAARSLAGVADDVTLPQYRALVVLATEGAKSLGELAVALGVHASTATRMCDRLVRKRLVRRRQSSEDRRAVVLELTPTGQDLVAEVTKRRRTEIARIVARVPRDAREALVSALSEFARAAGDIPNRRSEGSATLGVG